MAKAIMIQGTMSDVGKSFFSAALCRIFRQDGYRAAPFKSQNMALNSFVTKDGLEMGRAQVMQAAAAGTEPDVRMNPILLKPTTDLGSQVILNGEVYGNMCASDYFRNKKMFIPEIMKAYESLSSEYDIIVIEGAGSPVEMNLKADDIVNMGMARLAHSPVLLVGDIDRGGVFAQLLGTLSLLEKNEFSAVRGLVVNKFRGDKTLFSDGVRILEERGKKPVLGVVPYVECNIEAEDSLSRDLLRKERGLIDIAVIKLPKISNFTDFDVFSQYENVSVRYAESSGELLMPDLIIIPGTKSTIADMKWLREKGFESQIKRCAANDIPVFGICGGYQILGKKIIDPDASENGGETLGLGLLNVNTVFGTSKRRRRVSGTITCSEGFFDILNGACFFGYEIHFGETSVSDRSFSVFEDNVPDGAYRGNICGSYVHGIFDSADVSGRIVKALSEKKGIKFEENIIDRKKYKESQYDIIADNVRKNTDMKMIYRILEEGMKWD